MNPPNSTYTNGGWELSRSARGVLVLADPPEAGWRIQTSDEQMAYECDVELLAPGHTKDRGPQ